MAQQVEYQRASLLGSPPEIRNRIFLDVAMHHIFKGDGEKQVFNLQSLTRGRRHTITDARTISTSLTHRIRIAYFITRPENIERTTVMTMTMPHLAVRRSIRFLQLQLLAPRFNDGGTLQYSHTCGADGTDSLCPIRVIKKIGFAKLKKLDVVVKYFSTQIMAKDTKEVIVAGQRESQVTSTSRSVEEWIREQAARIDLEGIEYSLDMVYGGIL